MHNHCLNSAVDSYCELLQSHRTVWYTETEPGSLKCLMFSCKNQLLVEVNNTRCKIREHFLKPVCIFGLH